MAELYTVEPFSTYRGIAVKEDEIKKQYFRTLTYDFFDINARRIYVSKVDTPKIINEKLAMLAQERIIFGILKKIKNKFIFKKSRGRDNTKILFSSYKEFVVKKGVARYLIEPKPDDEYVLIIIEKDTKLELFRPGWKPKEIKFDELK